jgi:hypothetical protein
MSDELEVTLSCEPAGLVACLAGGGLTPQRAPELSYSVDGCRWSMPAPPFLDNDVVVCDAPVVLDLVDIDFDVQWQIRTTRAAGTWVQSIRNGREVLGATTSAIQLTISAHLCDFIPVIIGTASPGDAQHPFAMQGHAGLASSYFSLMGSDQCLRARAYSPLTRTVLHEWSRALADC